MLCRFAKSATAAFVLTACARTEVGVTIEDAGSDAPIVIEDAGPPPIKTTDKVDVLLVIDNTSNLDLAQSLLGQVVPYLTNRLAHPPCVNGLGNVVATPTGPNDPCPVGERDFKPIVDFHLGVITTSIGGHGADTCSPTSPNWNPTQNDAAHLITRDPAMGVVPTYQNQGFLAWDPTKKDVPPGESDLDSLTTKAGEIIQGVGRQGCGYESQLESIYRFLVDPNPYQSISVVNGAAVPQGTDAVVLRQRADFMRSDSAVVVLLLTDENDCSTREGSQFFLSNIISMGGGTFHLPRARSECAASPSSACCASCQQPTPPGCAPTTSDPECAKGPYTDADDPTNLRCFDQKRRFGIDFLYPVDRYVNAFTKPTVADRAGDVAPNPIFVSGRTTGLFVFGAVVGVPWQDIAIDPKSISVGFKPGQEMDWSIPVGDPPSGVPPADPLMIESIDPRMGANPVTGSPLAPPTALIELANPINGHERTIPARDDLQYACIYQRPAPKDCTTDQECECTGTNVDTNPICQQPDGTYSGLQRAQRALPGIRELQVVAGLGPQGVPASICAANTNAPGTPTFGYQPAIDALMRTLRRSIAP